MKLILPLFGITFIGVGFYAAMNSAPDYRDNVMRNEKIEAERDKATRHTEPGIGDAANLQNELVASERDPGHATQADKASGDQKLESAVRRYIFDDMGSGEEQVDGRVLHAVKERTYPVLLQILRDPSLRARLVEATRETTPKAPFNRLCGLLDEDPPTEAPGLLAPFLDEPSADIRKSAALVLGSAGDESAVSGIRKSLADTDDYVRSYAIIGIRRAIDGQRLSEACRREVFPDLQRLITEGENGEAAGLLLAFDKQRATEFFLSDSIFRPQCGSLHHVLKALNWEGLLVPRNRLLSLIDQLRTTDLKYPRTYQLGEALHSLGKHRHPEDRVALEGYVSHSEVNVVEGAAAGLLSSHGLDGFHERIWKTEKFRLTAPQRRYIAVLRACFKING